jgi:hypothetical protein
VTAHDVVIRGAGVLAVAGVLIGGGTYVVGDGGGDPFTANVYLASSGGSSGCTRSATPLEYDDAAGHICNTFDVACSAATGGDIIGVKDGAHAVDAPARRAVLMDNGDCSDGAGANTNPNGSSIPASWVSFQCADGAETPRSVEVAASAMGTAGGSMDINAKLHAEFKGRCFYFPIINMGLGDATLTSQYVRFDDVQFQGFQCLGCQDVAFLNAEHGPAIFCGQDGGPVAEQYECNPSGPYWESRWAARADGNVDLVGMEMYLHQNSGAIGAANISYINVYSHDIQTKENVGWHPGCLQTEKLTGLLIDRSRFERCAIEPILLNDPFTLVDSTIQNSMIGCNTDGTDNAGGTYDQIASGSQKTIDNGGNMNNVLIRYNTLCTQAILSGSDTFTNARLIANLFLATGTACSVTGITYDYNVVVGGTCGANSTNVSAGLVVNRGVDDNNCSTSCTALMDHHLTGSAVTGVDNAVTPTSSDYALTYDYDGDARTSGSRDVGADER